MKKIIDGKMYNTETAVCVGTNGYSYPGNFNWFEESLYQKKSGEFFVFGEGGAKSKFRKQIDTNAWSGGEDIFPLTENEEIGRAHV